MTDPTAQPPALTRGELARASGLSPKALRLYDTNGLLLPERVDPVTGYRYYGAAQLDDARTIASLRRLDMPLADVRTVLACPPEDRAEAVLAWWRVRRDGVDAGQAVIDHLVGAMSDDAAPTSQRVRELPPSLGPVRTRETPARTVACTAFRTTQAELVPRFTAAVMEVRAVLAAAVSPGGGPAFGIEHWVVYHGAPGQPEAYVEVCVPYEGPAAPSGNVVLRVEPAGNEAYVEVSAAQCSFPQILGANRSTRAFADAHGGARAAMREVYAVPWADDAAHVADVVLPLLGPEGRPLDPAPGARPTLSP